MVGCLEEIAYRMDYITAGDLERLARAMRGSTYGQYLLHVLETIGIQLRPPAHAIYVRIDISRRRRHHRSQGLRRRARVPDGNLQALRVRGGWAAGQRSCRRTTPVRVPGRCAGCTISASRRRRASSCGSCAARCSTSPSISARVADLRPVARRDALGRQPQVDLHPAGLRARLLRRQSRRRSDLQDDRGVRARPRVRDSLGRSGARHHLAGHRADACPSATSTGRAFSQI